MTFYLYSDSVKYRIREQKNFMSSRNDFGGCFKVEIRTVLLKKEAKNMAKLDWGRELAAFKNNNVSL